MLLKHISNPIFAAHTLCVTRSIPSLRFSLYALTVTNAFLVRDLSSFKRDMLMPHVSIAVLEFNILNCSKPRNA